MSYTFNSNDFYHVPIVCLVDGNKVDEIVHKDFVDNFEDAVEYAEKGLNSSWEIDRDSIGEWTYANLEENWEHDVFSTKQEAILHGEANYDEFLIGQLIATGDEHYAIENIQKIEAGVIV